MSQEGQNNYTCPSRGHYISFQLLDEFGNGANYSGLHFEFKDRMGQIYNGKLNSGGAGFLNNIHAGPAVLSFPALYSGLDDWYLRIVGRDHFPLEITALQYSAEQSLIGPVRNGQSYLAQDRADAENAIFYKTEVRDFVNVTSHLPATDNERGSKPSPFLKTACNAKPDDPGIALEPNRHHIIEVKALRAYVPLLSRDKPFCALNNYHLNLMAVTSYANFNQPRVEGNIITAKQLSPIPPPYEALGSIADVLQVKLGGGVKPVRFNDTSFHAICEEVPYSKRLEIVPLLKAHARFDAPSRRAA